MAKMENENLSRHEIYQYVNFPIELLKDATSNFYKSCNNILDYALYECTLKCSGAVDDKIEYAKQLMKLTYPNSHSSYINGMNVYNSIPKGNPKAGIRYETLIDMCTSPKTSFDIDSFIAFCAIRSILQTQSYCKITNDIMLARMAGNARYIDGYTFPQSIEKYRNRYHMDRLKEELQNFWGLKLYGFRTRGFYISFQLEFKELVYVVENMRKSNIAILKNDERKKIRLAMMNEIKLKNAKQNNNTKAEHAS